MKDIFLKISDRLVATAPSLRWIDLEKGQADDGQGIAYPAALIDIAYPSCEDISGRDQQCRVTVTVRIVLEAITDETNAATPAQWRERSLSMLDTVQEVVEALQGFGCDIFSNLSRSSQRPERRGDGLKVYEITFNTTLGEDFED